MEVSGQGVGTRYLSGLMDQGPGATPQGPGVDGNTEVHRRISRMVVVVSTHQVHLQGRVPCAPFGQGSQRLRLLRPGPVKKIPQKYQLGGASELQQLLQALHHRGFRGSWNGQSVAPEGVAFSKVGVSHQQQAKIRIKGRTVRPQLQAPAIGTRMSCGPTRGLVHAPRCALPH